MQSLAIRLQAALQASGVSQAELARYCRVRPSSVSDWLSGESKSMKSEPLLRAAVLLAVNPLWLAFGEGPRSGAVQAHAGAQTAVVAQEPSFGGNWPFNYISAQRWFALPLSDRLRIEAFAQATLEAREAAATSAKTHAR